MTVLVALVLSLMYTGLKPIHDKNEAVYAKKAILSALGDNLATPISELSNDQIQDLFKNQVVQRVYDTKGNLLTPEQVEAKGYVGGLAENIDMVADFKKPAGERLLPVYIYDNNGKKSYVVSVRGKGLWDAIWGNIALKDDLNTIVGVDFDHKGETPGLGAEIKDNAGWKKQFIGKQLFNNDGEYVSVDIIKGGVKAPSAHKVDGISGATITADGTAEMLQRGLKAYVPIIKGLKK